MSVREILARQRAWALERWPGLRGHVLDTIEDNLLSSLNVDSREEFREGAGDELGLGTLGTGATRSAKMRSLRSSSALAINVFDPWRGHDLARLVRALGLKGRFTALRFERRFDHGLSSMAPNVDVVLYEEDGSVVGIECKFCEPYAHVKEFPALQSKYFPERTDPSRPGRWEAVGLTEAQALAQQVGTSICFKHLDAGQLLKHLLGLARHEPRRRPVRLVYLWYDADSTEGKAHRREVDEFGALIRRDREVEFIPVTYQGLFSALAADGETDAEYLQRLEQRYFKQGDSGNRARTTGRSASVT